MAQEIQGSLEGSGLRISIVVAQFNKFVTARLLQGAKEGLKTLGVRDEDVRVVWVPGSFEIPITAKRLAQRADVDAVVCLGAVIRHKTDHHKYVAGEAARGIADVARETGKPVMFGVLTTDSEEQALERAGGKEGNKGFDAARGAVQMANLVKQLRQL